MFDRILNTPLQPYKVFQLLQSLIAKEGTEFWWSRLSVIAADESDGRIIKDCHDYLFRAKIPLPVW